MPHILFHDQTRRERYSGSPFCFNIWPYSFNLVHESYVNQRKLLTVIMLIPDAIDLSSQIRRIVTSHFLYNRKEPSKIALHLDKLR